MPKKSVAKILSFKNRKRDGYENYRGVIGFRPQMITTTLKKIQIFEMCYEMLLDEPIPGAARSKA
jgi:hypothetical protein